MAVAVAKAIEAGADGIICASTGNTAASAAAYAARAGLRALVLYPAGAVALAKVAQSRAVGARVLEVRGKLRRGAAQLPRARRARASTSSSTRSTRTGSRGRRRRCSRSSSSSAAGRRTSSRCPTAAAATPSRTRRASRRRAIQPRMISAHAVERATTMASAIRIAEPAHIARGRGARRRGHASSRSPSPTRTSRECGSSSPAGGDLLRAVLRGRPRRDRAARPRAGQHGRLRPHRPRPEGHGRRRRSITAPSAVLVEPTSSRS